MIAVLFPGQGTQRLRMGKDLFEDFPELTFRASEILGYSLKELCLEDPEAHLHLTQYTQPALYAVNALAYYKKYGTNRERIKPDFLLGHSLGEYNALLAAEAFDFETGLKLVQKRGELMGAAFNGGMLAVFDCAPHEIQEVLNKHQLQGIDLANYNTPVQTVISGPKTDIELAGEVFRHAGIRAVPLNVNAAFHSRYMQDAGEVFYRFIKDVQFSDLKVPVIANATGRPYRHSEIAETLKKQISQSVLWTDSIQYLMDHGELKYVEIGSSILTRMVNTIRETVEPIKQDRTCNVEPPSSLAAARTSPKISPFSLGSEEFRKEYGIKYAYLTGAMFRGIASKELVIKMGRAGLMGYFGTGGLSLQEIEETIQHIQRMLNRGESYGMNLLHNLKSPQTEMDTVSLYIDYGVRFVEAAAYLQMTPSLVWYRLKGLSRERNGELVCKNRVLAKVSRPEVAEAFMSPAPESIVKKLLAQNKITTEEAELSQYIPLSNDICVEADSGGHTDRRLPTVLMPAIKQLKKEMMAKHSYRKSIRVGLAGGIGTPESAAAAFIMGADFILTGSINQCTVEGGTSDVVKDLLQNIGVQDTDYAPAGDMFELGTKVQVLKQGVFFPARANKLFSLYSQYDSLDEIPDKTRIQLEQRYFNRSFEDVWEETKTYFYQKGNTAEIEKAEKNPKHKMALVFQWYFAYSVNLALSGDEKNRVNFQVHTGPALGAFNQWVKGTSMENWRNRYVDQIAEKMMQETAQLLEKQFESFWIVD